MLHYPKMPNLQSAPAGKCWAFEKCDGTNLHFDWERDFGWHAFGTRRDTFNLTTAGVADFEAAHPNLAGSAALFEQTLAHGLSRVFAENGAYQNAEYKVFAEFLGPNSFAGLHKEGDAKALILFDIWAEGFGFIGPEGFLRDFGHLPSARLVYQGKLTGQFSGDVRNGKYSVAEGVVCKGGSGGADVWRVKIKTRTYQEKLKAAFAANWEDYWE